MRSVVRLSAAALVMASTAMLAVAAETREIEVSKLKLTVPAGWTQQRAQSSLRLAQFAIPAVEGDKDPAELVLSGPFGGSVEANIERWKNQFDAAGRTIKTTTGTSTQGDYYFVDMSGTYKKPDGPPILQKTTAVSGYRMYGVILKAGGGDNYFLKLTGPDKTVTAQAEALRTFFGAKQADEKEYAVK